MKEDILYDIYLFEAPKKLKFIIDESLFEAFGCKEDFSFPLFNLEAQLEKINDDFKVHFYLKGKVTFKCDLTLMEFIYPLELKWDLQVRFHSDSTIEDEEEIVFLPPFSKKINIAKTIYEKILLSFPIKRIHPDLKDENSHLEKMIDLNYL